MSRKGREARQQETAIKSHLAKADFSFHISDGNQSEIVKKKVVSHVCAPNFSHFLRCVFVLQEGEIKMHLTSVVRFGFGRAFWFRWQNSPLAKSACAAGLPTFARQKNSWGDRRREGKKCKGFYYYISMKKI